MNIEYRKAEAEDALLLIRLYNDSFYEDFKKYGECPAYGRTEDRMKKSIEKYPKKIIYCDDVPVGVISVQNQGQGRYYLGCLCVIPEYQGRGIGAEAVKCLINSKPDWTSISLITPADKEKNIKFYTEKCGFKIGNKTLDGNVEVINFFMQR